MGNAGSQRLIRVLKCTQDLLLTAVRLAEDLPELPVFIVGRGPCAARWRYRPSPGPGQVGGFAGVVEDVRPCLAASMPW